MDESGDMMGVKDEFAFIKAITPKNKQSEDIVVGIGDDAAIFRSVIGFDTIACTDTMVEGVHFKRETMDSFHIGYKAIAANISDIAAMGGIPLFYLVSIAIPKQWDETNLIEIYKGMEQLATEFEMNLIGGDTVSTSGPLVVNVTVIGKVECGKGIKRSHAKPGDVVFITGTTGDSAAGLHILLNEKTRNNDTDTLVQKHQMPKPNVKIGRILQHAKRVALNDISDGTASEAIEIAEASGVDLLLYEEHLPLSKEILSFGREQALRWGLFGGEDYELIGTIDTHSWNKIKNECDALSINITKVGEVLKGNGKAFLKTADKTEQLLKQGFNHFR
jgi:thiamine-monophosphate kinase